MMRKNFAFFFVRQVLIKKGFIIDCFNFYSACYFCLIQIKIPLDAANLILYKYQLFEFGFACDGVLV